MPRWEGCPSGETEDGQAVRRRTPPPAALAAQTARRACICMIIDPSQSRQITVPQYQSNTESTTASRFTRSASEVRGDMFESRSYQQS